MAITIKSVILGQEVTDQFTFCYLYEPLEVHIVDSQSEKIYIDLELWEEGTGAQSGSLVKVDTLTDYVEYDSLSVGSITVDLMEIVRQHTNHNSYKFSDGQGFEDMGVEAVFTKYKYVFKIHTNSTTTPVEIRKTPIKGSRRFEEFAKSPSLPNNSNFIPSSFSKYLWKGFTDISLDANGRDALHVNPLEPTFGTPSISNENYAEAVVHWKSRKGGWSSWGFELMKRSSSIKYGNSIEQGMFESTSTYGGTPYVAANYSSVSESYQVTLKSLNIEKSDLESMEDIQISPAIYLQLPNGVDDEDGRFELMRLNSASVPLDSMADGGDVTITLSNISNTTIKTI